MKKLTKLSKRCRSCRRLFKTVSSKKNHERSCKNKKIGKNCPLCGKFIISQFKRHCYKYCIRQIKGIYGRCPQQFLQQYKRAKEEGTFKDSNQVYTEKQIKQYFDFQKYSTINLKQYPVWQNISPSSVIQGSIGTCALLSYSMMLSEQILGIKKIFTFYDRNIGFYVLKFQGNNYEDQYVSVDANFPIYQFNYGGVKQIMCCYAYIELYKNEKQIKQNNLQLWPLLIEKAYIKFCGGITTLHQDLYQSVNPQYYNCLDLICGMEVNINKYSNILINEALQKGYYCFYTTKDKKIDRNKLKLSNKEFLDEIHGYYIKNKAQSRKLKINKKFQIVDCYELKTCRKHNSDIVPFCDILKLGQTLTIYPISKKTEIYTRRFNKQNKLMFKIGVKKELFVCELQMHDQTFQNESNSNSNQIKQTTFHVYINLELQQSTQITRINKFIIIKFRIPIGEQKIMIKLIPSVYLKENIRKNIRIILNEGASIRQTWKNYLKGL